MSVVSTSTTGHAAPHRAHVVVRRDQLFSRERENIRLLAPGHQLAQREIYHFAFCPGTGQEHGFLHDALIEHDVGPHAVHLRGCMLEQTAEPGKRSRLLGGGRLAGHLRGRAAVDDGKPTAENNGIDPDHHPADTRR